MAKTKRPFLSMGSSGTIGGAITSQKRGSATLLRAKPTPTDPYSLAQAYQRWLYQDYCAEWLALSAADKQIWRSAGTRFHLTGMSCFLRNRLNTLPDIAAGYRLDFITGNSVIDFSKNLNHGTVYGATLVDGRIDHGLFFDGIDDYLDCGTYAGFYTSTFTYEAFVNCPDYTVARGIMSVGWNYAAKKGAALDLLTDGSVIFYLADGVDWVTITTVPGLIPLSTWQHVAGTFDGETMQIFIDGLLKKTGTQDPVVYDLAIAPKIGIRWLAANWFKGVIDEVRISNRVLTPSDILRHSLRRYPV